MTKSTGDDWVGVPVLARELGVTMPTLYKLLDASELPAYKFGRVIRIRRADVEAFLEQAKVKPGELRHLYPPREHSALQGSGDDESRPDGTVRTSVWASPGEPRCGRR